MKKTIKKIKCSRANKQDEAPIRKKKKKDISVYIDVLGTIYTLTIPVNTEEMDKINADGFCDDTAKEIQLRNLYVRDDLKKKNALIDMKRNLRHELIHAFVRECGLAQNNSSEVAWPVDEAMVDWWALQYDRIGDVFKQGYEIFKKLD